MARSIKLLTGLACLGVIAITAAAGLTSRQAQAQCCAGPPPDETTVDAIVYFDPNLRVKNSNISGDIGIAEGGGFIGFGSGTVTGTVMFAAPATAEPLFSPDGITVTGGATFGNANVQANAIAVTTLSQTLGRETGTLLSISGGGSVNASTGMLDGAGNRVFTANIVGVSNRENAFIAGSTFTINGSSSDRVVVNIPSTDGFGLNGSIVLEGGITPDHVLFNLDAGDFATLSGGDTLLMDTAGNMTTGIFLDPNGNFKITDTSVFGRIFGGGSQFDSVIQASNIVAPPPFVTPAPEPASLALLGASLIAFGVIRRRHRPPARP